MEDEISAMAAVIGASLAGAKSLTATSGPGMSLKLENLGYGYMAEVPCVVLNVMRGGPSTGTPTGPGQPAKNLHPAYNAPNATASLPCKNLRSFSIL